MFHAPILAAPDADSFWQVFAVNTLGSLLTLQKALPLLRDGGSVILNGTAIIGKGLPGSGVYAASKAANRSLVRTWAAELGGRHIRVNILSPGAVHTPAQELLPEPVREFIVGQVPLGRLGEPPAHVLTGRRPDGSHRGLRREGLRAHLPLRSHRGDGHQPHQHLPCARQ